MDLFAIERFNGSDSKADLDVSASKSSNLQRLLAKIEEKKAKVAQKKDVDIQNILNKKKNKDESVKGKKRKVEERTEKPVTKKKKTIEEEESAVEPIPIDDRQFTVLGDDFKGQKKSQVATVLPYWLQNPTIVSSNLHDRTVGVHDLAQLSGDLVEKLKQNGITHFFPAQHTVIPWLLESQSKPAQFWPRDVCVCVPTGSGKTLTFVLPIIQALKSRLVPHIRALIVAPVKELANQIWEVFSEYSNMTDLRVVCLNGNDSFKDEQAQLVRFSKVENKYCSRADIVVTTPGRLVDHLQSTTGFTLHCLKYLVIDEADRVLQDMQNDWLYHLEKHLVSVDMQKVPPLTVKEMSTRHPPPQKLLFSATLSKDPEKLQKLGLFRPIFYTYEETSGGPSKHVLTTPAELTEYSVACELAMKPLTLHRVILEGNWNTVLIFVNSLDYVHKLAILLKEMFKDHHNKTVSEVSSTSDKRQKRYKSFASGGCNILVTTDALARGVDFPHLDCVICYDFPLDFKTYIHRVGRAGRAGRTGTALTLVEQEAEAQFKKVFKKSGVRQKIQEMIVDASTLEPNVELYQMSLESVKRKLQHEHDLVKLQFKKEKKGKLNFKKRKQKNGTEPSLNGEKIK